MQLPVVGFEPWSSHTAVRRVTAIPLRPADDVFMRRRSLSGVSSISVDESIPVDPRENNYDSSESESERNEVEACVLTHRHVR